ncbi:TRAP transporter permease [Salsuginibacillus kocurii]|uniref:TRAP transporter permease n=1 Tax=Salsuginibacillus kocurii TaxID=427078 RepID=UPI00036CFB18|nr:TRAP transporter permease [Salsuginibacillus kocurii]
MSSGDDKKGYSNHKGSHENRKSESQAHTTDKETVSKEEQEEVLDKYASDTKHRELSGKFWLILVLLLAVGLSLFHLYTAGFGQLMAIKQRAVHLGIIMILVFLLYPMARKRVGFICSPKHRPSIVDIGLALVAMLPIGYIVFNYDSIISRGAIANQTDIILGTILMLLVLEAARRTLGWILPLLAVLFILYALYGNYVPGPLQHGGYSYQRLIEQMYVSTEGIFGVALGVSATFIFLFILFGAFMNKTGMGALINDLSMAIAGRRPGGPAKVAMIGSSTMGTINGTAVANVVTTGAFTIPLMKKIGYKRTFAGAIEAVASAGGQIMPPVMGAAAFILAELTGIPYATVIIAAIIPALLYYIAAWTMIDREARRLKLKGLEKHETPAAFKVLKARGHMLLPLFVVIYLLFEGFSPLYAAFYGIIATWVISLLRKETRMSVKDFILALEAGSKTGLPVGMACAVVGFIVGTTSLTSAGVAFSASIIGMTEGILFFTLFLTMIACIILGMGLPTTAAYIMAATIAAPALIELGVSPLAAHLFVFYFAILSTLTPPVAIAAYAAAGMAKAPPFSVGWVALKLAIAGFIIPFIFVYHPSLLLIEGSIQEIVLAVIAAVIGVIFLGIAVIGYFKVECSWLERLLLAAGAIAMIVPGGLSDIGGLVLLGSIYIVQKKRISSQTEGNDNMIQMEESS